MGAVVNARPQGQYYIPVNGQGQYFIPVNPQGQYFIPQSQSQGSGTMGVFAIPLSNNLNNLKINSKMLTGKQWPHMLLRTLISERTRLNLPRVFWNGLPNLSKICPTLLIKLLLLKNMLLLEPKLMAKPILN